MHRARGFKLLTILASAGVVTGVVTLGAAAGTAAAATPATSACTFNNQPANSILTGMSPGGAITVACTGLPDSTGLVIAEASPLAAFVPSTDAIDEADTGDLKIIDSSASGTLAPTVFNLPTTFTASDHNAACPITTVQINAGLTGCAVAVATLAGVNYGNVLVQYVGQAAPATPSTFTVSPTTVAVGQQVTLANGAGPGEWWSDPEDTIAIPQSDITVGGVEAGTTTASVSPATYSGLNGTLSDPALSGTFTVPCLTTGTKTVDVTEPDATGTVTGSTTLNVTAGTSPAVTGISPAEGPEAGGNTVTITGCNFTNVHGVDFGTTPGTDVTTVNSGTVTAIAPAESGGTVNITVIATGGTSPTSTATEYTYQSEGYDLVGADGGTFSYGGALNQGSLPGLGVTPAKPIVGIASTPTGKGYWEVGADGGVFAFGDAFNYGSLPGLKVTPAAPIVGIAATPTGKGYWLVGADGGIFAFGDARDYGSLPGLKVTPAKPIVGITGTNTGNGYWLVGADGGIFAFGGAKEYGSLPGLRVTPAKPVVGIIATSSSTGYWLAGADGGVYAFGNAPALGSLPGLKVTPVMPIVAIVSPDSGGYSLIGADGGVFCFGNATYFGGLGGTTLNAPIVGATSPS
jgi:hypothetical protein